MNNLLTPCLRAFLAALAASSVASSSSAPCIK